MDCLLFVKVDELLVMASDQSIDTLLFDQLKNLVGEKPRQES